MWKTCESVLLHVGASNVLNAIASDNYYMRVPACLVAIVLFLVTPQSALGAAVASDETDHCLTDVTPDPDEGRDLYMQACAACHGADGKGRPASELGLEAQPPDFSDCNFATREPDADWIAVAHQGGPVRGFSQEMPSFGDALTESDLENILGFIRTFCTEDDWPRGELNFPRALVIEKAYPEDELVISTTLDSDSPHAVVSEIVYEKRYGARSQIELVLPVGYNQDRRHGQLGDLVLGYKRVMLHSLDRGSILSLGGEFILPTGNPTTGIGHGYTRFEPFVSYGQELLAEFFLQFQGGVDLPLEAGSGEGETFARVLLGRTLTQRQWGRAWSPMVSWLGTRALGEGAGPFQFEVIPQMQVALNTRQHVMVNVGVRLPIGSHPGDPQLMVYILWEWFDGGFFEGW